MFRFFFWIFVICCVGLGYLGSQEVSDSSTMVARILAIGYFGYLLVVLPVLGLVEKTRPLPVSIAEAVLPKGAAPAE
jgi:ubiquinol-cytochrome c reductase cytochrome b/c1 subunit